jgi:NAD(P)-dependent dehydrogenase (short-subunit alcohol dehydrogenase family)
MRLLRGAVAAKAAFEENIRVKRYDGKVAIVTGGGNGIGRATAHRLASEGAAVAIMDLRAEDATAAAESIAKTGGRALAVAGDAASESDIAKVIEHAVASFGPVNVLVNNVARTLKATLMECTPEDWDREFEGTLKTAFLFCRAILPQMVAEGGGAIVNIGSVNGFTYVGNPAYSAAKAGLLSLTQAIAVEYGPRGVRANMVSPGTIRTSARSWVKRQERDPQIFEKLARFYPVGRVGRPDDIAAAVAYLGSDDASFVNGANLVVDGGLTAGQSVMVDELTVERDVPADYRLKASG